MANKRIPEDVLHQLHQDVEDYNLSQDDFPYVVTIQGSNVFLDRMITPGIPIKIGRLQYNFQKSNWDFAVFQYNNEKYDSHDLKFRGAELLDGTVLGALKAGEELYPVGQESSQTYKLFQGCILLLIFAPVYLLTLPFKAILRWWQKS